MNSDTILIILIAIVSWDYLLNLTLTTLNHKSLKKEVPEELRGIYDDANYKKSQNYQSHNNWFGAITGLVTFILTICTLYFGWLGKLNAYVGEYFMDPSIHTAAFLLVLFFLMDVLGLPGALYRTFVIEDRYGFNKTTLSTFFLDKIKGYLIGIPIGVGLLALFLLSIRLFDEDFWLVFWVVVVLFTLFLNFAYTSLILPLFNKLTPMESGETLSAIKSYCSEVMFPVKNIFVMDGSKRSTKGNAFFSGMGRSKKVVLFDTLLEKNSTQELLAVFAHEVGHYKKKHIVQGTILSMALTGFMLFLLSTMLFSTEVSESLGADGTTYIQLNLIAFGILYTPVSSILGIASSMLSRKNEYEADRFAAATSSGEALISALKKLSVDSLSNLTPSPIDVFINYSHPTLLQRIQRIRQKN